MPSSGSHFVPSYEIVSSPLVYNGLEGCENHVLGSTVRPPFTVSCWLYITQSRTRKERIVFHKGEGVAQLTPSLRITGDGGLEVGLNLSGQQAPFWSERTEEDLVLERWTHVSLVVRERGFTLFVDGDRALETNFTDVVVPNSGPFFVSRDPYFEPLFDGLTDMKLCLAEMSPEEIQAEVEMPPTTTRFVGHTLRLARLSYYLATLKPIQNSLEDILCSPMCCEATVRPVAEISERVTWDLNEFGREEHDERSDIRDICGRIRVEIDTKIFPQMKALCEAMSVFMSRVRDPQPPHGLWLTEEMAEGRRVMAVLQAQDSFNQALRENIESLKEVVATATSDLEQRDEMFQFYNNLPDVPDPDNDDPWLPDDELGIGSDEEDWFNQMAEQAEVEEQLRVSGGGGGSSGVMIGGGAGSGLIGYAPSDVSTTVSGRNVSSPHYAPGHLVDGRNADSQSTAHSQQNPSSGTQQQQQHQIPIQDTPVYNLPLNEALANGLILSGPRTPSFCSTNSISSSDDQFLTTGSGSGRAAAIIKINQNMRSIGDSLSGSGSGSGDRSRLIPVGAQLGSASSPSISPGSLIPKFWLEIAATQDKIGVIKAPLQSTLSELRAKIDEEIPYDQLSAGYQFLHEKAPISAKQESKWTVEEVQQNGCVLLRLGAGTPVKPSPVPSPSNKDPIPSGYSSPIPPSLSPLPAMLKILSASSRGPPTTYGTLVCPNPDWTLKITRDQIAGQSIATPTSYQFVLQGVPLTTPQEDLLSLGHYFVSTEQKCIFIIAGSGSGSGGNSDQPETSQPQLAVVIPQPQIQPQVQETPVLAAIELRKIHFSKQIGRGNFAKVFEGTYLDMPVAIKHIHISAPKRERLLVEMKVMVKLQHQYVVRCYGVCLTDSQALSATISKSGIAPPAESSPEPSPLPVTGADSSFSSPPAEEEGLIVMERCVGSLEQRLRSTRPFGLSDLFRVAKGVAAGMNFLHTSKPKIVHRDLKSMNILLDSSETPKIADFGLARYYNALDRTFTHLQGTLLWMAPEMLKQQDGVAYDEKVDVYSFAIVLWEMAHVVYTGSYNFPYFNIANNATDAVAVAFSVVHNQTRPLIPHPMPEPLRELMVACWSQDPNQRPAFREVLSRLNALEKTLLPPSSGGGPSA